MICFYCQLNKNNCTYIMFEIDTKKNKNKCNLFPHFLWKLKIVLQQYIYIQLIVIIGFDFIFVF